MNIEKFIRLIRDTDPIQCEVFTRGGCYRFHLLLKEFFDKCKPYFSKERGHIITLYEDAFYDINGVVLDGLDSYELLSEEMRGEAESWGFSNNWNVIINLFHTLQRCKFIYKDACVDKESWPFSFDKCWLTNLAGAVYIQKGSYTFIAREKIGLNELAILAGARELRDAERLKDKGGEYKPYEELIDYALNMEGE